jgi:hypothetical protein
VVRVWQARRFRAAGLAVALATGVERSDRFDGRLRYETIKSSSNVKSAARRMNILELLAPGAAGADDDDRAQVRAL